VRTSRSTRGGDSVREAIVPVRTPYRLDLTAIVLRRLSTNVVDVFEDGVYRRLIGDPRTPTLLRVRQSSPGALAVSLEGPRASVFDPATLVERILGTERELGPFTAGARRFRWLAGIARAARGVKPPRYPSLWETVCNAVVYQQVSIHAAGAILRRVIERYGVPVARTTAARIFPFPPPQVLFDADPLELRDLGLSIQKITALKRVARAILDGNLAEASLELLPTPELVQALVSHRGIGPWTAAVIALRGFGRLDIFPMKDSGAEKSLRLLSGEPDVDVHAVLDALAPQQGMLYYHLLLSRLVDRGAIVL
jgi:DNA-3-methyladenine glycosylase II